MSKINGDKARQNVRDRKRTKLREKLREIQKTLKPIAKAKVA